MKLHVRLDDVEPVDEGDVHVGCLVTSLFDPSARGMVVEFISWNTISVLWSTPPKNKIGVDRRDIW